VLKTRSIIEASTHALIQAHPEDTLVDVNPKLSEHNAVIVIGQGGELVGIVTRKDAIRTMMSSMDWRIVRVHEIMTREVLHVPNHVTLAEAANVMLEADIHQLVITGPSEGGGVPVGIITLQDLIRNAV
jgi:CBS domain-containing protein